MFVDPAVGVTEILSWLREVAIIGGIVVSMYLPIFKLGKVV